MGGPDSAVFFKDYGNNCNKGTIYKYTEYSNDPSKRIGQLAPSNDALIFHARRISITSKDQNNVDKVCLIMFCTNKLVTCKDAVKVKFYYPGVKPLKIGFSILDGLTFFLLCIQTLVLIYFIFLYFIKYHGNENKKENKQNNTEKNDEKTENK